MHVKIQFEIYLSLMIHFKAEFHKSCPAVKVKQSHYRPGVAQRVPGS
jgi:hypothetical protein